MNALILKVRFFFIVLGYLFKALAKDDIHYSLATVYSACILYNRIYTFRLAKNPELAEGMQAKDDEALLAGIWQIALSLILAEDLFRNVEEAENNPENIQKVLDLIGDFSEDMLNSSDAILKKFEELFSV